MTEPNKELPKEVVENITQELSNDYGAHVQEGGKPYSLSEHIKDRLDEEYLHYMEYYAPIIEGKDKQLTEKDATIGKLMELLKKNFMGRQRLFFQSENINIKYPISDEMLQSQFEDYCKENGIDLGGE